MAKLKAPISRRKSLLSVRSASSQSEKPAVPPTAASPQSENDRNIKQMLRQFKKLELAVDKFRAKHSGLTKANILRMLLLPFLRSLPPLEATFGSLLKIYLSFVLVSTTVLGEWWRVLLLLLSTPPNALGTQVSSTDRSAYLECISRIMARPEWASADVSCRQNFYGCLADTLDFCINRLQLTKVVLISMLAFVGKVFAYGFFHLPNVCNALLFLLNVKQSMVDVHVAGTARVAPSEYTDACRVFPKHLVHLIDYRGLVKLDRCKRPVINSIPPPKHPVAGIRDPSGAWVRRWCSSDSDIFDSFFRHYVAIVDSLMVNCPHLSPEVFPGFHIITSHIFQIFLVSINRILANMNKPALLKSVSGQTPKPQGKNYIAAEDMAPLPTSFPYKQNDTNYASIIKLFKTIRDINYSSVVFSNHLTRYFDLLLINVAKTISIFDFNKNGLLLNLAYEYSNHVLDTSNINWEFWLGCNYLMLTSTHHVQTILRSLAFLFNVWDKIPGFLTKHDDPQSVSYLRGWLLDVNESYKLNFSDWLTSSKVWLTYFTHWNSIVRGYYSRLLVWRIIGVNNYQSSVSMKTTKRAKYKLDFVHESICEILSSSELTAQLANLDFSADHPMLNRKFSILPVNSKFAYTDDLMTLTAISKTSDLRKTHPYEIFDEAIYTCTSLPSSPSHSEGTLLSPTQPSQKIPRNHSLINSLSRFFKILSTEDTGEINQFNMVPPNRILGDRHEAPLNKSRNSKLMTSLSSISVRSRSSSPSLMSFLLSPNTDNSADSSVKSDLDSSSFMSDYLGSSSSSSYSASSYQPSQPPELFRVPPEIVRPVFKFDIVVDQESAGERYMMMQNVNSERSRSKFCKSSAVNLSFATMPKEPKVPAVSIYLNSDMYNKFYITKEDYMVDDDILTESDMKDLALFSRQFAQCLRSPTDLMAMGKSLNEWNQIVHEFEYYLFNKVEADQANYFPVSAGEDSSVVLTIVEINEGDYFKRIIPFLSIDNFTEVKLLNAA